LQPNNSQNSNCQIRNTRISTATVTPCSKSWRRATSVLPKPTLSPVPPVLSGAHQARFSAQLSRCFRYLHQITAIAPARPIAQRSPSALSRSSMRREHCGNFSVARIGMSAEALQRAEGYPRLARRAARCSVLSCSRGTVVQATLSSFITSSAKFRRKVLKVRGLHVITQFRKFQSESLPRGTIGKRTSSDFSPTPADIRADLPDGQGAYCID
jgi:hypothetical protein